MNRQFLAVLVVGILAIAGGTALGVTPESIVLAEPPTLLEGGDDFPGMWEYVYDVYGETAPVDFVTLSGFDASETVNQWPWSGWGRTGSLLQKWDWHIGHYAPSWERGAYGSYAVAGAEPWILTGDPWSMDNPWHVPNDYTAATPYGSTMPFPAFIWAGKIADDGQSLTFISSYKNRVATGLLLTFRIVHPYAPGPINWSLPSGATSGTIDGPVIPPPEPPLGSFDGDQNVDEIDIDLLADAIRTGSIDFALFDISGDGVTEGTDGAIDILDLDYLVRVLVDTTMGVGTGSEYGDFNLDGLVDTTDLTRLATYFGPGTTWAEGNANRNIDLTIDTTDLTILGTYFGFDASVDAIPEPMTLFVMGCGAIGLLRRRRS